jgi:hypothetical protein
VSGAIKRRGGFGPFKELAKHGPIMAVPCSLQPESSRSRPLSTLPESTCSGGRLNSRSAIVCKMLWPWPTRRVSSPSPSR